MVPSSLQDISEDYKAFFLENHEIRPMFRNCDCQPSIDVPNRQRPSLHRVHFAVRGGQIRRQCQPKMVQQDRLMIRRTRHALTANLDPGSCRQHHIDGIDPGQLVEYASGFVAETGP